MKKTICGQKMNDFLNPKSMITPGISGGLIMLISNTLWIQFSIPKAPSSMILSFLLVALIIQKFSAPIWEKIIYFIFNGLIIFSLAINTNFAGRKISEISYREAGKVTEHVSIDGYLDLSNAHMMSSHHMSIRPPLMDQQQELSNNVPSGVYNITRKSFFDPYW